MNPFPPTILTPVTANRIPRTVGAEFLVEKLLLFEINASAFLMDANQLAEIESGGFSNDFDCAFEDLFYQIPPEIRGKVFPLEPEPEAPVTSPVDESSAGPGMVSIEQRPM